MRRPAKPFTVEIKKRGPRRREGGEHGVGEAPPVAPWPDVPPPERGRVFQDAEKLFRGSEPRSTVAPESMDAAAPRATAQPDLPQVPPSRRILPDLVAEAALSEAARDALPEPRRRGRPPKPRPDATVRVRVRNEPVEAQASVDAPDWPAVDPAPQPAIVIDLLASARRRAARATDNLPRGQRWKRRLPKVCW